MIDRLEEALERPYQIEVGLTDLHFSFFVFDHALLRVHLKLI